jgi:hypothetical protein
MIYKSCEQDKEADQIINARSDVVWLTVGPSCLFQFIYRNLIEYAYEFLFLQNYFGIFF